MPILEISKDYLIEINDKKVKIEIPERMVKRLTHKSKGLSKLFGSLRSLIIDPLKYQRRMRDEWER